MSFLYHQALCSAYQQFWKLYGNESIWKIARVLLDIIVCMVCVAEGKRWDSRNEYDYKDCCTLNYIVTVVSIKRSLSLSNPTTYCLTLTSPWNRDVLQNSVLDWNVLLHFVMTETGGNASRVNVRALFPDMHEKFKKH